MFALNLPLVEKILRPAIVYAFLVIMLRVFGKRELAQLNPFDLVVLLSVSNTVQNAIIGDDNSVTGGLVGAFTLFAVNYLVVRFLFKHRRLDEILEGTPTSLVEDGKLCHAGLAKELLSESELLTVAHRQGFTNARRGPALHAGARWRVLLRSQRAAPARAPSRRIDEASARAARADRRSPPISQSPLSGPFPRAIPR